MKLDAMIKASLVAGLLFTILGLYLRLYQQDDSQHWYIVGVIANIVFMITAIYEVQTARISRSEKLYWTIGFIILGVFVGLIYLLKARKRVVAARKHPG